MLRGEHPIFHFCPILKAKYFVALNKTSKINNPRKAAENV